MKLKLLIYTLFILIIAGCSNNNTMLSMPKYNNQNSNSNLNMSQIPPVQSSSDTQLYIDYINNIRGKGAVCAGPTTPLKYNKFLEKAAFAHANDMATNHFLSHTGSGTQTDPAKKAPGVGSNFFERILFFGYPAKAYDLVGENITFIKRKYAKDRFESFKKAVDVFLKDPPHCRILMEPRFKDIGVGYKETPKGTYWVVDFGETE